MDEPATIGAAHRQPCNAVHATCCADAVANDMASTAIPTPNVLNMERPGTIELQTTRCAAFIAATETPRSVRTLHHHRQNRNHHDELCTDAIASCGGPR